MVAVFFLYLAAIPSKGQQSQLLDQKLSLNVHGAERLESVIFRIESLVNTRIIFNLHDFDSYKARANNYKEVSVKQILEEQLASTPLTYQMKGVKLFILKKSDLQAKEKK